ncbi:phage tail protein [Aquimarina sp. TRL1]|uniref:phage tail sheath family protein n=1 Tax=Aquimarina sp. (strain TRL1) TaxID=2736252 RepID=UPI00158868A0|nr:phage tail sheath C-terminal domain-containing protein [Aquimarina sp. TRL1]QKX07316.1 phage tail protein [Aquimarina sp. TRL1]
MASTYNTPGVYIEEIVKFPPSVAQVETAIPAFIGYTEKATAKINGDLKGLPTRITSMLEYETYFGGAKAETTIKVAITDEKIDGDIQRTIVVDQPSEKQPFLMYYSMQMYFANGGGPCYIVSVGRYGDKLDEEDTEVTMITNTTALLTGLTALKKVDEPTLILFPDATRVSGIDAATFYGLYNKALEQCKELQDRFTIIDTLGYDEIPTDTYVSDLRGNISANKDEIKYGGVYYPYLDTILDYKIDENRIVIHHKNEEEPEAQEVITSNLNTMDVAAAVTAIANEIGDFDTTFEGSLIAVLQFLYDATNGFNMGASGAGTDVKNYAAPRPLTLHSLLETLQADLEHLIQLKENTNVEANAAISALSDEIPVIDVSPIETALTNFNDLFEGDGKIEVLYKALKKLTANLKKNIDEGNETKVNNLIDSNTSNVLKEIETLITVADIDNPADTDTTLFDSVAANWETLKDAIIDNNPDDGTPEDISQDTNNGALHGRSLASIEQLDNVTYNKILVEIGKLPMELPPSSTMAGIYAKVDNDRGVWKAPANVSLNYVTKPSVKLTNKEQDLLNVDVQSGKSINAIRTFTGKGVLVWGARTLAGNDKEWRYIPVRRFFNMAEESIKKATEQFVFEPNDMNTWVRVKAMINNFLTLQWRAGALAGPTPDKAFYVNVGLGETMTADDVLDGKMIIEIGMAVVRPAEFIILKFSHKMQEA